MLYCVYLMLDPSVHIHCVTMQLLLMYPQSPGVQAHQHPAAPRFAHQVSFSQ